VNELVVQQARTWLGTKFQHQGRIKASQTQRGGVDCIGLILDVAKELNIELPEQNNYGRLPDHHHLISQADKYLCEKNIKFPETGDILMLKIDKHPQHFALVGSNSMGLTIIHSYAPLRKVVEHNLSQYWLQRIVKIYNFL
jgi:cell wall-associated NlpC family hydrolase